MANNQAIHERSSCLFFVLTCHANLKKHRAVESTWSLRIHPNDDLLFVIGDPTVEQSYRKGNLLVVRAADDYDALPQKVMAAFDWAIRNVEFDYLLKCDDDTYIEPTRLQDLPHGEYVGYMWNRTDQKVVYASGGAGYRLSWKRLPGIIEQMNKAIQERPGIRTIEDMLVGVAAQKLGIIPIHSDRLQPFSNSLPDEKNQLVSSHGISPELMIEINDRFTACAI
jgi:hypothetical protein